MTENIRIINNKKEPKCYVCYKPVIGYKIHHKRKYYHLRCYYNFCINNVNTLKTRLTYFRKLIRRINKHKKQLIADSLQ